MAKIETWFPVAIYQESDVFSNDEHLHWVNHIDTIKQNIKSHGEDWYGGTYTTHGSHNIVNDPIFEKLIIEITKHVNTFANMHNSNSNYICNHAWLNVAGSGNSQEFHTHDGSIFSAVYYITAPEGSGKIVFEDPKAPDMLPLRNIVNRNELSFIRIGYDAIPGTLLIFRSYLRHMVEPGTNTTNRISVALNFS